MTRLKFAEVRPHPVKIQGLKTLIHRILKRSEVKSADVMRSHGFEYLKRKSEEYDARIGRSWKRKVTSKKSDNRYLTM